MNRDITLPDFPTLSEWIRDTRAEVGLTQVELGERADVSPSQISRLENTEANPSYNTVYRVYTELRALQDTASIQGVLETKHAQYDALRFEYVTPDDTIAEAARLMDEYDISQLPVLDTGDAVGTVTDTDLLTVDNGETPVAEVAGPPLPEVPVTASRQTVRDLLQHNPAVLVIATEDADLPATVGKYAGLVTAADIRPRGID